MTEPATTPGLVRKPNPKPHPEWAYELALGSGEGKWIFESIVAALKKSVAKAA